MYVVQRVSIEDLDIEVSPACDGCPSKYTVFVVVVVVVVVVVSTAQPIPEIKWRQS